MATVGSLVVKLQAQNQQANAALADTRNRLLGVTNSAEGAADATRGYSRELGAVTNVARAATAALVGLASIQTGREVIQLADEYGNLQNRLRATIDETQDLSTVTRELLQVANSTRASFGATVDVYTKFLRANEQIGASQQELSEVITTVNQAIALSGASATSAEAAILQLGQGLGAGALRGEELNSVLENTPVLAKAIADGLGITIAELRQYGAEGKLSADVVFNALQASQQGIAEQFSRTNSTISQSVQVLKNNLLEYIGSAGASSGATQTLSESILSLANNLEQVGAVATPAIGALAALLAGRLTAALGTATAGKVSALAASARLAAAERAEAAAALAAAQAAANQAQANTVLGISSARATTAQTALAAAQARYTAATTTATVATRAFAGAMSLVGGPVGLAVTAVTALALLAPTMDDGSEATERLTAKALEGAEALGLLAEQMNNLSLIQVQDALAEAEQSLIDQGRAADAVREQIADLKRQLDLLVESGGEGALESGFAQGLQEQLNEAEGALSEMEGTMVDTESTGERLRARLDEIFSSSEKLAGATGRAAEGIAGMGGSAADLDKAFEKLRTTQERVNEIQTEYNGLVQRVVESGRSQAEQAELIAQLDERRAEALRKLNEEERAAEAARKFQISDYQKLIGQYDDMQRIENEYLNTMRQIESAELSAIERKRLMAAADQERIDKLQTLKDREVESLAARIQGGQDTGAVNMGFISREGEGDGSRSNRTFEEQARALSDRIESGNMTAEGTAQALVGLRGFAEKLGALGEGFDVEGMKGAVDNLAAKALEVFKNGDQKPLTAEEYKKVFEEAQAKAEQKEKDQQASWQSIQNIDAQLEKYLSGDKSPKGSITIKVQKDSGTTEGVVSGDASFLQTLAATLQSVSVAV